MDKCLIGIDLGTSSLKILCRYKTGKTIRIREKYDESTPSGWLNSLKKALMKLTSEINAGDIIGIGLSAQVGTYIIESGPDDVRVMMWNENKDDFYLKKLLDSFTQEDFLREISMPHPNMMSYPIPKLMQIKNEFKNIRRIYQPKDFLCETLTGRMATDQYSWRGLANLNSGRYSEKFLGFVGIGVNKLPPIIDVSEKCGNVKPELTYELGLSEHIPVFAGCNDFFAGLLGMGIWNCGDAFDITGTSEHIGVIAENINININEINEKLICGGYFNKNVSYGVTSSSGAAIEWALNVFGNVENTNDIGEILNNEPPVFMPYIKGEERAPVWDTNARGVFFGVNEKSGKRELRYSVFEGVCFSLFQIREEVDCKINRLIVAGGAANNNMLNKIKAELFNVPVDVAEETDASALGAVMIASVGSGRNDSIYDAMRQMSGHKNIALPTGNYSNILLERYKIFKRLYPLLKNEFKKFGEIYK